MASHCLLSLKWHLTLPLMCAHHSQKRNWRECGEDEVYPIADPLLIFPAKHLILTIWRSEARLSRRKSPAVHNLSQQDWRDGYTMCSFYGTLGFLQESSYDLLLVPLSRIRDIFWM